MSANFTVDAGPYDAQGFVRVQWTNETKGANFYAWRVYRRRTGSGSSGWQMIHQRTTDAANMEYRDYLAPANVSADYAVVQATSTNGGQTISESSRTPQAVIPAGTRYWLIHPTDEGQHVPLHNVTQDNFTEEYEEDVLNLIGRGRKVDQGERWGVNGSLSAQLRDKPGATARQQAAGIRGLKAARRFVWLRNPFGDVWKVTLGDVQVARVGGVGVREFVDVTLPYLEVA
jgi:hypothetical protein